MSKSSILFVCSCGQPMRVIRRRMRPEQAAAAMAPRTERPDKPKMKESQQH